MKIIQISITPAVLGSLEILLINWLNWIIVQNSSTTVLIRSPYDGKYIVQIAHGTIFLHTVAHFIFGTAGRVVHAI